MWVIRGSGLGGESGHGGHGGDQGGEGEAGQGGGEARVQCGLEDQAAQAGADEEGEHVQSHGLAAVGGQGGGDARQKGLGQVVAQGQHGQGQSRGGDRQVRRQGESGDGGGGKSGGDEAGAPVAVGESADERSEDEAGDAVAEQGQTDADLVQAVPLVEVHAQPGVDPGVEDSVDQHVGVGARRAAVAHQAQVAGRDGPPRTRGAAVSDRQLLAAGPEQREDGDGGHGDGEEETLPADYRLQQRAGGGADRHPAGHRAEQPAQGVAAAGVGEQVAEQGQRDGHHAAGAEGGDDAGGDEPAGGAGEGGGGGERDEGGH